VILRDARKRLLFSLGCFVSVQNIIRKFWVRRLLSVAHTHVFKAFFGMNELAYYECACGETRPSNWRGEK